MKLRSEWRELGVGDTTVREFFCCPAATREALPGVLVLQEAWVRAAAAWLSAGPFLGRKLSFFNTQLEG